VCVEKKVYKGLRYDQDEDLSMAEVG